MESLWLLIDKNLNVILKQYMAIIIIMAKNLFLKYQREIHELF